MESDSDLEECGFGGIGITDEVLSEVLVVLEYFRYASRDVVGFSDWWGRGLG